MRRAGDAGPVLSGGVARVAAGILDAGADLLSLLLPLDCVGCGGDSGAGRERRGLCDTCADELAGEALRRDPTPCPAGLPPCIAVSAYAGVVRSSILALKEQGLWSLARPLGRALAGSVVGCPSVGCSSVGDSAGVVLVPVPSSRAAIRARGDDPLALMTRHAARILRAQGRRVEIIPALVQRRRRLDQSGLDSHARQANLADSLVVGRYQRRLRERACRHWVCVLVDDIVTTGATLSEAARALREVGIEPVACAVIAATRRRGG